MIGTTLSHYRIVGELGRGGMGIVYKAEDTKLERTVAIKVLPAAALSNEDDRARFYREAKAAAALNHPHIAAIYQIDEAVPSGSPSEDLRPFIAMEFIEGGTLEDRIKDGPLKLNEAVRIATQVAEALKAAHAKSIVHRDIKSANIMLTTEGQAKVLDFGLAQTTASTKLTRMGSTLGTVAYMSPEQARGEAVDQRTDIWSLGVSLYEMVTGRMPFTGQYEEAAIYGILNVDPEPLTSIRTNVPVELEMIVDKAMSKNRDHRYASCTDLLVDLRRLDLSANKSASRFKPLEAPKPERAPRPRSTTKYIVAAAIIIAAALGFWGSEMMRSPEELPLRWTELPVRGFMPSVSAEGRYVSYVSTEVDPYQLHVYDLQTRANTPVFGATDVVGNYMSPDGSHVGFVRRGEGYYIVALDELEGLNNNRVVPNRYANAPFRGWTDSGDLIYTSDGGVVVGDFDSPESSIILTAEQYQKWDPVDLRAYHEENSLALIVTASRDSTYMVIDVREDIPKLVLPMANHARFLPDGSVVYLDGRIAPRQWSLVLFDSGTSSYSSTHRTLWQAGPSGARSSGDDANIDLKGEYMVREKPPLSGLLDVAIIEDGEIIPTEIPPGNWGRIRADDGGDLVVLEDRTDGFRYDLVVFNLATNSSTRLTQQFHSYSPTWIHSEDRISYLSGADSTWQVHERSMDGSTTPVIVVESEQPLAWLDVSVDGFTALAFISGAGGRKLMYDRTTGQRKPDWSGRGTRPILSPNGQYVILTVEGVITVVDISTNQEWRISSSSKFGDPRWSIDGRTIYLKDNINESRIFRVSIPEYPSIGSLQEPELVFDNRFSFEYDVLPGENRFVGVRLSSASDRIEYATGWAKSLRSDRE